MKNFKEFFSFNFYLIKGKGKFPDRCPFEEFVTNLSYLQFRTKNILKHKSLVLTFED